MRKTVTKECNFCDNCGNEESYLKPCLRCGKEVCWRCTDKAGVNYKHGVYASGSGDGFYCTACDILLSESDSDPLHVAYREVRSLRDELEAFSTDFQRRQKETEGRCALLGKHRGV